MFCSSYSIDVWASRYKAVHNVNSPYLFNVFGVLVDEWTLCDRRPRRDSATYTS